MTDYTVGPNKKQRRGLLALQIAAGVMLLTMAFVSISQIGNTPTQYCNPVPNQQDVFQVGNISWRVDNSYKEPIFSQLNDQEEWIVVDEFPFGLPGDVPLSPPITTYEVDGVYYLNYDEGLYYWNTTNGEWILYIENFGLPGWTKAITNTWDRCCQVFDTRRLSS